MIKKSVSGPAIVGSRPGAYQWGGVDSHNQAQAATNQAKYGAQAQKDTAAFGAMGNLGIAGQNAMGQYGMNRDYQLTNQAIAAANAMGSQNNSLMNMWGQLGQSMAGMAGAAGQAGADTNKAAALGGLGSGMINASMYGAQMAPYTAGNMPNFNMGFGFGGGGGMGPGFHAGGPEGTIASGSHGLSLPAPSPGGGGGTQGRPFNQPPPPPYVPHGGGGFVNPYEPFKQGAGFLGSLLKASSGPNSPTNTAMNNTMKQFDAARGAVMDPSIINSLNNQMTEGYGALSGLYGQSDYGFNTKRGQKRL